MEHINDHLLVYRARAGDEAACAKLVENYYPGIYQYCRLHMYDAYEAEDLTQEIFAAFFHHLDSYREYGKVRNYLYTIAGNMMKNYYKKKKDIPLETLPDGGTQAADGIQDAGVRMDIERAVQRLPDEIREVAILFFFQELKQREIAQILQLKLSLVKYRIGRARELLQQELKEVEHENL